MNEEEPKHLVSSRLVDTTLAEIIARQERLTNVFKIALEYKHADEMLVVGSLLRSIREEMSAIYTEYEVLSTDVELINEGKDGEIVDLIRHKKR
jgi:hypothetical protein